MKQIGILGGLLAVALIASYATWFDTSESAPREGVALLDVPESALTSVTWDVEDTRTELVKRSDDVGSWLQVTVTKIEAEEPEAADTDPEQAAEAEATEADVETFVGNEKADEVWQAMAPLLAIRDLGAAGDDRLGVFQLDEPAGTLTVAHDTSTFTVALGGEAYGTRDRYAKAGGRIVLLDDKALRPMQFARTRLMERRLQPYAEEAIKTITVATPGGPSTTLTQVNAADRASAFWASAEAPDRKDATAATWVGKLLRLRLRAWTPAEEVPTDRTEAFTATVAGDDGTWTVTVSSATDGGKTSWWGEASWLRATVELTDSLAEEAAADVDALFAPRADDGADEVEEEVEAEVDE